MNISISRKKFPKLNIVQSWKHCFSIAIWNTNRRCKWESPIVKGADEVMLQLSTKVCPEKKCNPIIGGRA